VFIDLGRLTTLFRLSPGSGEPVQSEKEESPFVKPKTPEDLGIATPFNVVICAGQESYTAMFDQLKADGKSVHLIGGA